MNELEIFYNIAKKIKNFKKTNTMNFIPRQTICVNIDDEKYYISLICDENFEVKVILLDGKNNIIYEILSLDSERASIVKLKQKLYVFTDSRAHIFDINNLKAEPNTVFFGNLGIQGVCANDENIFAYSIVKDKIIKYSENLVPLEEYNNYYSRNYTRVSIELTCNHETFFSIPIMIPTEEQYLLMKSFIKHYINSSVAEENDQIHSCSFNDDENTLYITMYNLIWIIKNGTEFSHLYFKDNVITTASYDNESKDLIINFSCTRSHFNGSIIELSNDEIKKMALPLANVSTVFKYSKNLESPSTILLDNNELDTKKRII